MVCEKVTFDDISYIAFSILHELGHWIQYSEFIVDGHNDQEFIEKYELERALLVIKRKKESDACRSTEDIITLNKKYDQLYAELSTERYANNFALEKLPEYMDLLI